MIYFGIVEDRIDPLKLGRCKVRIVGLHSPKKEDIPTDDLPWAYPIQPITSAGISGVGYAPVGLVEGSWVCVTFKDATKQIPVILGSIGGIPNDGIESVEYSKNFKSNITPPKLIESYSSSVLGQIKSYETFKSKAEYYETTDKEFLNYISPEAGDSEEYSDIISDENGYYIAGYNNRAKNGYPFKDEESISQGDAEKQLKIECDLILSVIRNTVRAPLTQSMMDALVIFVHGIGINRFRASRVLTEVNAGSYEQAAASMLAVYSTDKERKRRALEKDLFLKEEIPGANGSASVTLEQYTLKDNAFNHPTGKYPTYKNQPDTNRLARHEDIGSTIVPFKESARVVDIPIANGANEGAWSQPNIPYNTDYPFNKVFASESGHLLEFDDTQGSERVHLYHKAGTFTEIDVNGSQVNRIVGDNFEIMERNGHVYIRGAEHVNIEGSKTLKVGGTFDVEVAGATNINIYNDTNVNISGIANVAVLGAMNIKSADALKIQAKSIDIKAEADINIESGANTNLKSGSATKVESGAGMDIKSGAALKIGSGAGMDLNAAGAFNAAYSAGSFGVSAASASSAGSASETGLEDPAGKQKASERSFSELNVPKRQDREAAVYEAPDEGDSKAFVQKRIESGSLPKEEAKEVTKEDVKETTQSLPKNNIQPPVSSCDIIFGMKDIPKNLQLSKNYNLMGLTANGSRPVINQVGLTKQQIVCNLKGLCENCLEPIKQMYPNIIISSGFRRPGDVAGSSPRSQHYNGEAADLVFSGYSKKQVFDAIHEIQKKIPYDQLLLEYAGASTVWVHVSFVYKGLRKQTFTMKNHARVSPFGKFMLL